MCNTAVLLKHKNTQKIHQHKRGATWTVQRSSGRRLEERDEKSTFSEMYLLSKISNMTQMKPTEVKTSLTSERRRSRKSGSIRVHSCCPHRRDEEDSRSGLLI